MAHSREKVRAEIAKVLGALTTEEQHLLSKVIRIEEDQIHLTRPRVKDELVRQVRLVIS